MIDPDEAFRELDYELSTQPHDAYFKRVFSDPVYAAGFFRQHLPAEITSAVDWSALQLVPGSFVKSTLQQAHSDLLFSAGVGDGTILFYLLFEHQTSVDPSMPLRLLAYMLEIWQSLREQGYNVLPPILPFVLHQGPDRWTVPLQFADMFALPAGLSGALKKYQPHFEYALLDLTQVDPASAEAENTLRVVLKLMKMARQQKMPDFFEWLEDQGSELPEALLNLSILYALHADQRLDVEAILRRLQESSPLYHTVMSAAQKLKQEGREVGRAEGRVEGREEGCAEGIWKGKFLFLEEMMGRPATPPEILAPLNAAEMEALFLALELEYHAQFKKI